MDTIARGEEQRIQTIVDRRIRETFKNGLPAGLYSSYLWDGMKIVGSSAGGSAVGARVRRAATFSLATSATAYSIDFDTEDDDDAAYWDIGTPADIVMPSTALYLAEYSLTFAANATGQRNAWLESSFVCGAQTGGEQLVDAAGAGVTTLSGSHVYRIAAGCVIRVRALQSSGGALNVTGSCTVVRLGDVP